MLLRPLFECVKKALASPIHGGTPGWPLLPFGQFTFRWPSEARSEGVPTFLRKVGISEYLLCKYSGSPRPSATPLINEGGQDHRFFDKLEQGMLLRPLFFRCRVGAALAAAHLALWARAGSTARVAPTRSEIMICPEGTP